MGTKVVMHCQDRVESELHAVGGGRRVCARQFSNRAGRRSASTMRAQATTRTRRTKSSREHDPGDCGGHD